MKLMIKQGLNFEHDSLAIFEGALKNNHHWILDFTALSVQSSIVSFVQLSIVSRSCEY